MGPTVSTPPLSQVGRALVRYRMLQEDSQLGRSSMLTLRVCLPLSCTKASYLFLPHQGPS